MPRVLLKATRLHNDASPWICPNTLTTLRSRANLCEENYSERREGGSCSRLAGRKRLFPRAVALLCFASPVGQGQPTREPRAALKEVSKDAAGDGVTQQQLQRHSFCRRSIGMSLKVGPFEYRPHCLPRFASRHKQLLPFPSPHLLHPLRRATPQLPYSARSRARTAASASHKSNGQSAAVPEISSLPLPFLPRACLPTPLTPLRVGYGADAPALLFRVAGSPPPTLPHIPGSVCAAEPRRPTLAAGAP